MYVHIWVQVSGHTKFVCGLMSILQVFNSSNRHFWVSSKWRKDPWSVLKGWIDLCVSVLTVSLEIILFEKETPKADLPESLLWFFYTLTSVTGGVIKCCLASSSTAMAAAPLSPFLFSCTPKALHKTNHHLRKCEGKPFWWIRVI